MSNDGRFIAQLTKHGLSVTENGKVILSYLHKSKYYERDIKFISETELLWKMTGQEIKLFCLKDKKIRTILKSKKLMDAFVCENEVYLTQYKNRHSIEYKKIIIQDGNFSEKLITTLSYRNPQYALRQFRKSGKVKLLFSYTLPAQLLLEESTSDGYESVMSTPLENNSIIFLNNNLVIKYNNRTLFFYTHSNDENLKTSYALSQSPNTERNKAEIIGHRCYCYFPGIRLVLVYNMATNQKLQYLVAKDTREVVFQNQKIIILGDDNRVNIIRIMNKKCVADF